MLCSNMETPSSIDEGRSQANPEVEGLRQVIQDTIEPRGRYYHEVFPFAVRFEADNTHADKDTKHFQHMLKMLGLLKARELVIERNDRFPAWTVQELIGKLCKLCADTERQYLVIAHYAAMLL